MAAGIAARTAIAGSREGRLAAIIGRSRIAIGKTAVASRRTSARGTARFARVIETAVGTARAAIGHGIAVGTADLQIRTLARAGTKHELVIAAGISRFASAAAAAAAGNWSST